MSTLNNHHIDKIDFLRGIAIIGVFIFHCQDALFPGYTVTDYKSNYTIDTKSYKDLILNFIPSAYRGTGVTLFLIISGFLIHVGFLNRPDSFKISTFYSKRFWRIYPLYLMFLIFLCVTSYKGVGYYFASKVGFADFVKHAFLIHNLWDSTILSINPSLWSLALEVQLYLIYPLFLLMRNKCKINLTFILICFISLLFILIGIFNKDLGSKPSFTNSLAVNWFVWCSGAFLAEKYYNNKRVFQKNSFALVFASFLLLFISKFFSFSYCVIIIWGTLAWLTFFEWFLYNQKVNIQHWFFKFISLVGICSYSFYLIHQPYLLSLLNNFYIFPVNYILDIGFKICTAFIILFLISYSLYLHIELNSVALGKKIRDFKKMYNSENVKLYFNRTKPMRFVLTLKFKIKSKIKTILGNI